MCAAAAKYDLFISHASEDKAFVRPLAECLRRSRVAVWYDDFELKPGVGLRRSIDEGLKSSRFGLVVLSRAFFEKKWPQWELDGLVQLAMDREDASLLPLWLGIRHVDVAAFSPSLSNIVAITSNDPTVASSEVLRVLRPRPTTVEIARSVLEANGYPAPTLSDDWWLEAASLSAEAPGEGTFQEASGWGWWGFPLPPLGDDVETRGQRIAWAAMMHAWKRNAVTKGITACTQPSEVIAFIESEPGLAEIAARHLDYLLYYVPQLGLPTQGGFLEEALSEVFSESRRNMSDRPRQMSPGWLLRDKNYFGLTGTDVFSRYFWSMDAAATSPEADALAWIDIACWLSSTKSEWLPRRLRSAFTKGIQSTRHLTIRIPQLDAYPWDVRSSREWQEVIYHVNERSKIDFVESAYALLSDRIEQSRDILKLPESTPVLLAAVRSTRVLERYRLSMLKRRTTSRDDQ
jgi:hypothetical protein